MSAVLVSLTMSSTSAGMVALSSQTGREEPSRWNRLTGCGQMTSDGSLSPFLPVQKVSRYRQ